MDNRRRESGTRTVPHTLVRTVRRLPPILLALALAACADPGGAGQSVTGSGDIARPKATAPVPVVVGTVARTTFPVELRAIGTGQASKTVSVESQVAGIVKAVHYRQGQFVHAGEPLVTLDTSLLRAALGQSEAALARDEAQQKLAEADRERSQELEQKSLIPREQYEQSLASSAAAAATVRSDEAALQTAKIQLSYGSVVAPISGVTGAQLVYPGATVKANDAPVLVVINQIAPIFVNFSVPQQYLESIKRFMARGPLPVEATPTGDSAAETGVLTFVNNTVDASTGTIELMASFPNADRRLWPGQFCNVVLRLQDQPNVLVVPSQAVQTGQQGDYVFVVKPDKTVDVRRVKVGRAVNDLTEVLAGLSAGETVVTDGQVRLVSGTRIYVTKGLG